MKLGLTGYGTTFAMGLHPLSNRARITGIEMMKQALDMGVEGVELPLVIVENALEEELQSLGDYARENKLFINITAGFHHPEPLKKAIRICHALGGRTVRTRVGGALLGGDRRPMAGIWQSFLQEIVASYLEVLPVAESLGINLTVENHQDLASEELIWLCGEINSPLFGVTLDTGNPLGTGEEPISFFKRIAPFVKNVHLKDYWIYVNKEGYLLVRCPLGQGVIDFTALFEVLEQHCPDVTCSIELGALEARAVRILANDFWPEYPARTAAQLAETVRFVLDHAEQSGEWQTPFERKEHADNIIAYEKDQLNASLRYMKPLIEPFKR
jgi:sugar phosphate isomerase/epimerase